MAENEVVAKHPFEDEVTAENAKREGVGTRLAFGMTRGKGSMPIKWEKFDEAKPDTLPKSVKEFVEYTKSNEAQILEYLIVGYNDAQYTAASDPIAEFVNPAWSDERKAQFRLVVRNLSKATGLGIEEAVTMVKPGVEKAHSAETAKS